jgi:hypothetical protein
MLRSRAAASALVLASYRGLMRQASRGAGIFNESIRPLDRVGFAGTAGIVKALGELVIGEGRDTACERK